MMLDGAFSFEKGKKNVLLYVIVMIIDD